MFERDKNELRDLGIPLETGRVSQLDPTEGYRINREAYALPAGGADRRRGRRGRRGHPAVGVARADHRDPGRAAEAAGRRCRRRRRRRRRGDHLDRRRCRACAARRRCSGILLSAIDSGQAVQFPHRPSRSEPYTTRTVEPWGVVTDRGRWYLVGHDRDRDATRTFRLSRIGAEVTADRPARCGQPARRGEPARDRRTGQSARRPTGGAGQGVGRRRPRHRAAPRGRRASGRGPWAAATARRSARHRDVRPAGPRDRELRCRRGGTGAAVAARRRADRLRARRQESRRA